MPMYRPRVTDLELERHLAATGAVLIEGPKACGKTETATQVARTTHRVDDPVVQAQLSLDPASLFVGDTPILFDEWQIEPDVWQMVRREVDDRSGTGHFILTGSSRPRDDARRHSGAGRFSVIQMRPMSLFESGQSSGAMSLHALLDGETQTGLGNHLSFDELLRRIVIGGWPELLDADEGAARTWLEGYLDQIVEVDIPDMGHRRNPANLHRLLEGLARGVGQAVKQSELAKDVGGEKGPIAGETIAGYLAALDRLRLTDNSPAWRPHMRSRTRLRSAPVRYFVDPSLATAALRTGSAALKTEPRAAGFHFEALAVRDLRIYAQANWGAVSSWRDANGNEVDAIVTARDQRWAAFEVKLNPRDVDTAASALLRFAEAVDATRHQAPTCLGVITSSGVGGRRPDGVHVIPIGCLGP